MSDVFRVQNPTVLDQPIFMELLERAVSARPDLLPPPDEVKKWLDQNLVDPNVGLFVAVNDEAKLGGLLIASIYTWTFSKLPWLLYLFSDHWSMTQELCLHCQKWFLANGFDRCYGFNTTEKPDQDFERLAEHLGCRVPTIVQLGEEAEPEEE
jgi:hypothetical protein